MFLFIKTIKVMFYFKVSIYPFNYSVKGEIKRLSIKIMSVNMSIKKPQQVLWLLLLSYRFYALTAAIPGNTLPSKYSNIAPPPVDT
jgi:hypothetical protein